MLITILALLFAPTFPFQEASAAPTSAPPKVAKVLMIGIDGVRPDALLAANTPYIDQLVKNGAIALQARTTSITSSGPAWTSILTGSRMMLHGVHDNSFEGSQVEICNTWLEQVETQRPDSFTAAISQWGPIHEQLTTGHIDISGNVGSGAEVTASAQQLLLEEQNNVTALFLHYDDVDHAGHDFGYAVDVPEYIAAIEKVDAAIGLVLAAVRERVHYAHEDWLFLVGTDHGGKDKGHGGNLPECRTVFMIASGDSVTENPFRENPEVIDFATMALHHLGLRSSIAPEPRDWDWWPGRHDLLNQRAAEGSAEIAFFGDSITHGWEGDGKEIWNEVYAPLNAMNFGISADRTEHVLWRMRHGNLKTMQPKVCVVMIGTNNSHRDSSIEIAKGVEAVVAELLFTYPETKVLLLAIFPRGENQDDALRKTNQGANSLLDSWSSDTDRVHFLNMNSRFLEDSGVLSKEIMPDLLHPNPKGYRIWAEAMAPTLTKLLAD